MRTLSHNALKGLKNTDGGVSPRLRMVEAIALKGRQIVLPPLRGFVGGGLSHPGAYTPVCDLSPLRGLSNKTKAPPYGGGVGERLSWLLTSFNSFISELSERFFREAGFLPLMKSLVAKQRVMLAGVGARTCSLAQSHDSSTIAQRAKTSAEGVLKVFVSTTSEGSINNTIVCARPRSLCPAKNSSNSSNS